MLTIIKCNTSLTCCLDCHKAQLEADQKVMDELIASIDHIFSLPRVTIGNANALWQAKKKELEGK